MELPAQNQICKKIMACSLSEVTGVSPSEGSILGGTLLTIQGHYFDETDQPAMVLVGGNPLNTNII